MASRHAYLLVRHNFANLSSAKRIAACGGRRLIRFDTQLHGDDPRELCKPTLIHPILLFCSSLDPNCLPFPAHRLSPAPLLSPLVFLSHFALHKYPRLSLFPPSPLLSHVQLDSLVLQSRSGSLYQVTPARRPKHVTLAEGITLLQSLRAELSGGKVGHSVCEASRPVRELGQ